MNLLRDRRRFLQNCGLVTAGAAAGLTLPGLIDHAAQADDAPQFSAEQRIKELGLELPEITPPVATYVATVQVDNLLFVAGHGPRTLAGESVIGKVGSDMTLEQGQEAARLVALRILATVRNTLGSLDRVGRLVKTLGMVNCTTDFTKQPLVINGFSDLMVDVFGDTHGKGTRSAVGMASLPGGIPVEIECVFQIRKA